MPTKRVLRSIGILFLLTTLVGVVVSSYNEVPYNTPANTVVLIPLSLLSSSIHSYRNATTTSIIVTIGNYQSVAKSSTESYLEMGKISWLNNSEWFGPDSLQPGDTIAFWLVGTSVHTTFNITISGFIWYYRDCSGFLWLSCEIFPSPTWDGVPTEPTVNYEAVYTVNGR